MLDRRFYNSLSTGGGCNITKECVEEVLTGNIETHRHDSRYVYSTPKTDTWNGILVSESLQGSGNRQNPYLIQSCADYVHFIKNPTLYSMNDGQAKFVTITKNLNFGNHEIDMSGFFDYGITGDTSNISFTGIEVDGAGMVLSNLNLKNAWSVFPRSIYSKFHDIHIRDANFYINGSVFTDDMEKRGGGGLSMIRGIAEYGAAYNVSITGVLHINGDIKPTGQYQEVGIYAEAHAFSDDIALDIKSSSFSSIDVQFENSTPPELNKNAVYLYLSAIPGSVSYSTCPTTYDGGENMGNVFYCVCFQNVTVYADQTKTLVMSVDQSASVINKTWEEMKSDSFVDLLNSYQNVFDKDINNVNGGFPVFKPTSKKTLAYDGYVRDSIFEDRLYEIIKIPVYPFAYRLTSLSNLPTGFKTIKVQLSESSELSFDKTPEEESEYIVYVKNNSSYIITQQIKVNDSWKCKVDSVNIQPGEIIILHIRYAFDCYLVSIDSF